MIKSLKYKIVKGSNFRYTAKCSFSKTEVVATKSHHHTLTSSLKGKKYLKKKMMIFFFLHHLIIKYWHLTVFESLEEERWRDCLKHAKMYLLLWVLLLCPRFLSSSSFGLSRHDILIINDSQCFFLSFLVIFLLCVSTSFLYRGSLLHWG